MLDKILHRGPDQKILKTGEYSSIGFVRLSILDLSENSNQIITDIDNNIEIFLMVKFIILLNLKKFFPNKKFKKVKEMVK